MRNLYWMLFAVSVLATLVGVFAVSVPLLNDVSLTTVEEWYQGQTVIALVLGVIVGGAFGMWARKSVRYRPGVPARKYPGRVAGVGVLGLCAAALASAAWSALGAYRNASLPFAAIERLVTLTGTMKFVTAVVPASMVTAAIAYALVTALGRSWGGSYAIVTLRRGGNS